MSHSDECTRHNICLKKITEKEEEEEERERQREKKSAFVHSIVGVSVADVVSNERVHHNCRLVRVLCSRQTVLDRGVHRSRTCTYTASHQKRKENTIVSHQQFAPTLKCPYNQEKERNKKIKKKKRRGKQRRRSQGKQSGQIIYSDAT